MNQPRLHNRFRIGNLVWGGCLVMLSAQAALAGDIVMRPQAVPQGSVVRLGDVAEIRGVDKVDADRLAALPLVPSPAAGTQRFLRQRELQDMIAAHGEDLSAMHFAGAAQVAIQPRASVTFADAAEPSATANRSPSPSATTGRAMSRDSKSDRRDAMARGRVTGIDLAERDSPAKLVNEPVRGIIVDYIAAHSGNASGWNAEFNLSDRQRTSLSAATSLLTCEGGAPPWTGKQRFVITFDTADGPVKMPLLTDVTLTQPVLVALRAVAKGSLITAADVDVQSMDNAPAASGRRTPLHAVEDIVGMEAGRAIQAGEIIYTDQVASPILVRRNETVTVIAQGGGIRVRTAARARQDGARGDLVQVESLDTKERYDARVTGMKEVSVLAPARMVALESQEDAARARATEAEREPAVFRKYQQSQVTAPPASAVKSTAFRKFTEQNGKVHVTR